MADDQIFPAVVQAMNALNKNDEVLVPEEVWHYVKLVLDGLKMSYTVKDYTNEILQGFYIKLEG